VLPTETLPVSYAARASWRVVSTSDENRKLA